MNKKGITLIEMVVTIMILSIASLMLFGGFSAVINIMGNSGRIKNNSDTLLAYAEGKEETELNNKIEKDTKPLEYTISSNKGGSIVVNRDLNILNVKDDDKVHLKTLEKPNMQKVKDTEAYKKFNNELTKFYRDLKKEQDEYEVFLGNTYPFNAMLKKYYVGFTSTKFPKELLPKEYTDTLAGQSVYVNPYYPWEIQKGNSDVQHGDVMIFLHTNDIDPNNLLNSTATINMVYDYESDKWYYHGGNDYTLTFKDQTTDGKTFYDVRHNGYLKKWEDVKTAIKNPDNGWKVLDVDAEYNNGNSDSFWKDVE